MYEFLKTNNGNCDEILDTLINALKYTQQKYNLKYEDYYKETITKILKENLYTGITRENGMRNSIMQYTSETIFSLILNTLEKTQKYNLEDLYILINIKYPISKYQINEQELDFLISEFVKVILIKLNEKIPTNPNPNETIKEPRNIQMYTPSEQLREEIITRKQTSLKSSSYMFHGMQACSNIGKQKNNQEDSYYIGYNPHNPDFKILIVADGMGGSQFGEIASNIAVKELMLWFDKLPSNEYYNKDNQYLSILLKQKVYEINRKIKETIIDGGTTLCVAIIKNNSILMGNIGDSQGYILKDGKPIFATSSDSGTITILGLPPEIARFHKQNNGITAYLGRCKGKESFSQMNITETHSTYKVILCSDGVTDCISEKKIIEIASEQSAPSQALVEYAIANDSYLQDEFREFSNNSQAFAQMLYSEGQLFEKIPRGKDNTTAVSTTIKR